MLSISGVIVLYNPEDSVIENIQSYIGSVDRLYVIDNSDAINSYFVGEIKKNNKCTYVDNGGNKGIANALNVGIGMAIVDGSGWVLTMDQDSSFDQGMLENMIEWLEVNDVDDVGVMSPVHKITNEKARVSTDVVDVVSAFTSGNLLNINVYKTVGAFREDFFIDYVDHEYCLRLKRFNYRVLLNCNSVLNHSLGASKSINILGHIVICTNHDFIRRYYITRNRFKVIKMYFFSQPVFCLREIKDFIASWVKIILFEKDVIKKQKAIFLGMTHFLKGKYGKLEYGESQP